MDRKEFFNVMGISGGSIMLACMGCSKETAVGPDPAPVVDFVLDLSMQNNAPLLANGGYLYSNGLVIARTISGNYVAVSQSCTHAGVSVVYRSQDNFYCPSHGAIYGLNGEKLGGPANGPLKSYNTSLSGNMLRVYG